MMLRERKRLDESLCSPTMPLEPANSINSESQAPPGHHSESQAQAEPTEQIGHPLHVEEPVVCDSNPRVPSVLVTGQSASSVDFELKSWGRESPHSCTPSQEMEGYSDAPSRRCRTQSAPINEYTSGGVTRMLPMPSTQAECDRNHEIMKEFFDTYLVELPEEDFAFLGMKLLDCEYDKLLSITNIMKGTITNEGTIGFEFPVLELELSEMGPSICGFWSQLHSEENR
ncbi:hypothetical protein EMCRGX_G002376 [Ephydatia muelleri]